MCPPTPAVVMLAQRCRCVAAVGDATPDEASCKLSGETVRRGITSPAEDRPGDGRADRERLAAALHLPVVDEDPLAHSDIISYSNVPGVARCVRRVSSHAGDPNRRLEGNGFAAFAELSSIFVDRNEELLHGRSSPGPGARRRAIDNWARRP